MSFLRDLFAYDDPDASIRRVRRWFLLLTGLLAVVVGLWSGTLRQPLGLVAAAALMLLNFNGLVALSDSLLRSDKESPGALHLAFLTGRYALLGIGLCVIVLAPGVGPIPVALGLSVLVLAILLEAIAQALSGTSSRP